MHFILHMKLADFGGIYLDAVKEQNTTDNSWKAGLYSASCSKVDIARYMANCYLFVTTLQLKIMYLEFIHFFFFFNCKAKEK